MFSELPIYGVGLLAEEAKTRRVLTESTIGVNRQGRRIASPRL